MSQVKARIPTPPRALTGGSGEVLVDGETVGAALQALESRREGILARLHDGVGAIRGFVNVYVGEDNVKRLDVHGSATSQRRATSNARS
jgi:molybdopterin converting factor small subunit